MMLRRIRKTLELRAQGIETGCDAEIAEIVDRIVMREAPAAVCAANPAPHILVGTTLQVTTRHYNQGGAEASVPLYVIEEVSRQGHDTSKLDGIERVGWMLNAWSEAIRRRERTVHIGFDDVVDLGWAVERGKNASGLRKCAVRVGTSIMPSWEQVPQLLQDLLLRQAALSPLAFYRTFLEIHPFVDGNGRVGKILLNWKNDTLDRPIFPPNDFWGAWIRNP